MKVVHISSTDIAGGAARAAYRIHTALVGAGVDSWMLVQEKYGDDPRVMGPSTNFKKALNKVRPYVEPMFLKIVGQSPTSAFTSAWLPSSTLSALARLTPDIVHLHWICDGQMAIEQLRHLARPVVWTLHDMWPMTGGCHYAGACAGYRRQCGHCPILTSNSDRDRSRRGMNRKSRAYSALNLTLACPSQWMHQCARQSALFANTPAVTVPYSLDTTVYAPSDSALARTKLRLPATERLLMLSASDPARDRRKGAHVLLEAVALLHKRNPTLATGLSIAIVGCREGLQQGACPVPIHYLGRMTDDLALATCFAAADIVVAPSLEDNLPNTIMEALACGRPVIGSKVGGIPDLITSGHNGMLVPPGNADGLATALAECLTSPAQLERMGQNARSMAASRYSPSTAASAYHGIYRQIMTRGPR